MTKKDINGNSIFSLDVDNSPIKFTFFARRALEYDHALSVVNKIRRLISENDKITIFGRSPTIYPNDISAVFISIHGKDNCYAYFTEDCKKFPNEAVDKEIINKALLNPLDWDSVHRSP